MQKILESLLQEPLYRPLWRHLSDLSRCGGTPEIGDLNALRERLSDIPCSAGGAPIHFSNATQRLSAQQYELAIFERGQVATRAGNWHDLFNALVWLRFGKLKAALNALHCHYMGAAERGPQRDFATLLDESGVLLVYDKPRYVELLREREWHALFWRRRDEVQRHTRFFVVGHALFEKALAPYPGLTGKVLALQAPASFMSLEYTVALAEVDRRAACWVAENAARATARHLLPLPILGVPGWSAQQTESLYSDVRYFRPRVRL